MQTVVGIHKLKIVLSLVTYVASFCINHECFISTMAEDERSEEALKRAEAEARGMFEFYYFNVLNFEYFIHQRQKKACCRRLL